MCAVFSFIIKIIAMKNSSYLCLHHRLFKLLPVLPHDFLNSAQIS